MSVLSRFQQGDFRALSRIISFVENRKDGYRELLGNLYRQSGRAIRIGVTGPPGAGKSTLVNRLTHTYVAGGSKVGIVAVDPTSPFTGGALLGDRVRMNEFEHGSGVFFRSMATRGASGGLSSSTDNVAVVLDAFGFDIVLIETVGVGQVELDIVDACDAVLVVVVPESGDSVQTMKAGLMEIADIMVVNKADRPGSEKIISELNTTMQMRQQADSDWAVPVVATVAIKNENIDALHNSLTSFIDYQKESGAFERQRRSRIEKKILNILKDRFQTEFIDRIARPGVFEKYVSSIYDGKLSPYAVGEELYRELTSDK